MCFSVYDFDLQRIRQSCRFALAIDVRPDLLRHVHVAVHIHDELVGLGGGGMRVPGSRLALFVAVDGHADPWRTVARSPEVGERPVLANAQLRRRHRHCGLRHHPQRPNQSPLPAYRRASDVRKRTVNRAARDCGPLHPVRGNSVSGQAAALKKLWLLAYREAGVRGVGDALPRRSLPCALRFA